MSSDFKFVKFLEWCTDLPRKDEVRESPPFFMNGNEWIFLLTLENRPGYTEEWFKLRLRLSKKNKGFEQFLFTFKVGFKKEQTLSLNNGAFSVTSENPAHWFNSLNYLQSCLPSDYMSGNLIKFQFHLNDIDESFLKIRKSIEDKSVQTKSYWNADASQEGLSKDFSMLMTSDSNHDLEMKCGEHSVKAHKLVICGRSEVFKAMLQTDMREGLTGIVEIKGIDASHFHDFIKYLYTDILPELNLEKAVALYEAGDKYAVRSLMFRCSEYLQDNLCMENFFQCLSLADAHSDQKLKDRIVDYALDEKIYLRRKYWTPVCENFSKIANEVYRLLHEKDMLEDSE